MTPQKSMEQMLCIFILLFNIMQLGSSQQISWNCANDISGFKFNIEKISGIWYEIMRVPTSAVPACVIATAPESVEDDAYVLKLDYITNTNNQWKPTAENLTFPWNNNTQNGIFVIEYGNDNVSITFTFKLIYSDYNNMAVICYYANYAPTYSMIKIMTRQQNVNETLVNQIQEMADKYGFGTSITWVEQSDRCNSSRSLLASTTLLFWLLLILKFLP